MTKYSNQNIFSIPGTSKRNMKNKIHGAVVIYTATREKK
jgi:hypothetical protein